MLELIVNQNKKVSKYSEGLAKVSKEDETLTSWDNFLCRFCLVGLQLSLSHILACAPPSLALIHSTSVEKFVFPEHPGEH